MNPFDDVELPCSICECEAGACRCPECPVCGTAGDIRCEADHGLVIPAEQKQMGEKTRKEAMELWEKQEAEFEEW